MRLCGYAAMRVTRPDASCEIPHSPGRWGRIEPESEPVPELQIENCKLQIPPPTPLTAEDRRIQGFDSTPKMYRSIS
jgi:hypothetical protein